MNNIPLIPPPPPPQLNNIIDHFEEISFSSDDEGNNNELSNVDYQDLIVDEKDKNNSDYLCPICKSFLIPDSTMII